jgi:hypothetical protein
MQDSQRALVGDWWKNTQTFITTLEQEWNWQYLLCLKKTTLFNFTGKRGKRCYFRLSPNKKNFFRWEQKNSFKLDCFQASPKTKTKKQKKSEKRKTQPELLSSYFYFSKPASKSVDSRDEMLAEHKFSGFLHLICASKMNQWKCRHNLTGARFGETCKCRIFTKFSAVFLHFGSFTTIRFVENNVNCSNWRKNFEIYFLTF